MTAPDVLRRWVEVATPGPWHTNYWPVPEPHYWVGKFASDHPLESKSDYVAGATSSEADARLIAKAPEMATLLADIAEWFQGFSEGWQGRIAGHEGAKSGDLLARLDALVEER